MPARLLFLCLDDSEDTVYAGGLLLEWEREIVNSDFQPVYSSFLTHSLGSAAHKGNLEEEVRLSGCLLA